LTVFTKGILIVLRAGKEDRAVSAGGVGAHAKAATGGKRKGNPRVHRAKKGSLKTCEQNFHSGPAFGIRRKKNITKIRRIATLR